MNKHKKGFSLVVLVSILGIASLIICSQEYIGRVVRDVSIDFTNRVIRDLSVFAEGVRQVHVQHMNYRARLVSGDPGVSQANVSQLWTVQSMEGILNDFPGISTIKYYGAEKDVLVKPSIVCSVIKNEVLPGGHVIPATVSVTITINTAKAMYSNTMKDAIGRFLKSTYISGFEFDFNTRRKIQMTMVIGQSAGVFDPMRNF